MLENGEGAIITVNSTVVLGDQRRIGKVTVGKAVVDKDKGIMAILQVINNVTAVK